MARKKDETENPKSANFLLCFLHAARLAIVTMDFCEIEMSTKIITVTDLFELRGT